LALLLAAASATKGQSQSLNGLPVTCKGERITRIDIDASPPFDITGDAMWQRAARFAAKQHVTTKDAVIRRYLALQLGDRCTEVRRAESERILRAQPFIADASVLAYPDGNGGIILSVSTVDEVSLIIGAGIGGGAPAIHSLVLGEDNLLGSAFHLQGEWKKGARFRDIYAGRMVDYQFLGRPYQFMLQGGRRELGSDWSTEASHPFLTDLQRLSWRTTAGNSNGYFYFQRPNADRAAVKLQRSYSDIGGVARIGPPLGRLLLVGALAGRFTSRAAAPYLGVIAFFVTFLVMGVWHGTTTVFVIYGLLMGAGASANKLWQVALARWLGKQGYRRLAENPLYLYGCRGVTYAYFAVAVTCLWVDMRQLADLLHALGVAGLVAAFLMIAAGAAAAMAAWDALAAGVRPLIGGRPAIGRHLVLGNVLLAGRVLMILGVMSFFHRAPEFVYKAF